MFDKKILKNEELAAFTLRSLYSRVGYTRYKMSKFEEYDLYVRNKDFLISEGIITFTDTNGKLLALKPDVTLSIIKNSNDEKGSTEKLYYDENVYRISSNSNSFKEINQTGLECIGDISSYDVCEVLFLAIKSLSLIDDDYILDLSHAGLFNAVVEQCKFSKEIKNKVNTAIQNKSKDEIENLYNNSLIDFNSKEIILALIKNYKSYSELESALKNYTDNIQIMDSLEDFKQVWNSLDSLGLISKIKIDFSIVNDTSYYSGIVFKGYIKGIPTSVLSGGRYDKLMKKMGKNSGAVGFAVYLDMLERHNFIKNEFDFDYILIKDKTVSSDIIISKVEELSDDGKSVLVTEKMPSGIRYGEIINLCN